MKKLKTDRLILRAFKKKDLHDLYEYASTPGVGELAGWIHHQNLDETRAILEAFIKHEEVYAILLKSNQKVIGSLGVHANDITINGKLIKQKQIGYVLSKDYWGKGLMTEAVKCVIEHCFEIVKVDQLNCGHFDFNNASKRIIEKVGFKFSKMGTYYSKSLKQDFTDCHYLLTKEDYQKQKPIKNKS